MLVKTLLKTCATGFDLIIIADGTSGHTLEFSSIKEAQIVAGGDRIISWEISIGEEMGRGSITRNWVLYIIV